MGGRKLNTDSRKFEGSWVNWSGLATLLDLDSDWADRLNRFFGIAPYPLTGRPRFPG
jgi:hypothetical protein